MAKQSDLNFVENTKSCVFCSFKDIEFFWEKGTDTVIVSGFYSDISLRYRCDREISATDARKAIVKFVGDTFHV
ncbi:hypothetical protein EXU30_00340 [Shewanella maritima]|uniref:Uncharacterized protein n=1 Tax=Shewanella maritima TaxID=2520507 RepID=A0A411PCW8_9GAMM|nr:hypothetical protein [Shewanella maritima]QBF81282.1 hypothetical protein EXU30_00160 [Shewanella maritima]QBF81290.1 hypothetical protein EXU30_00200 [Shewanella maritima]QBF81299.1 hypothetical protein EXU30_00245 [Shewanella maritima]QBF81309.1 hypothetical protein EXU30_00295 [Shewanella maritima]QBF81318.1 hypothetical protein EXU30_00340 [Shewanella maritima]